MKKLEGKTIVNTVTHDPFAAHDLDGILRRYNIHHISALVFGVPETVCGSMAKILISAPDRTIPMIVQQQQSNQNGSDGDSDNKDGALYVSRALAKLGTVYDFSTFRDDSDGDVDGYNSGGDVGLASVVYIALIQSLYFGLAGYELSLLLLTKYMDKQHQQQYQQQTPFSSSASTNGVNSVDKNNSTTKEEKQRRCHKSLLFRYQELSTDI